ncbi:hypothetical protein LEN26_014778 [Aphanomyces euteiches]|nr:hypothetical protein LEN26_014778 [Aphanomyces euteiches]
MRQALERYLNENCLYTLRQMQQFLAFDFNVVKILVPTISRHLIGMPFTMKQARVEPSTCNSDVNKSKRQVFALKLLEHQEQNDYKVFTMRQISIFTAEDLKEDPKKEPVLPWSSHRAKDPTFKSSALSPWPTVLYVIALKEAGSLWMTMLLLSKRSISRSRAATLGKNITKGKRW